MAEKKGFTGKLQFDFNVASCLEVEYNPNKWARTTAETFRSWGGNRRILNSEDMSYIPYKGPVYLFMSNMICSFPTKGINYIKGESAEDYISQRFKTKLKSA